MNIVYLSEQNVQLVAGSVSYSKMILKNSLKIGNQIFFIYPSICK